MGICLHLANDPSASVSLILLATMTRQVDAIQQCPMKVRLSRRHEQGRGLLQDQ